MSNVSSDYLKEFYKSIPKQMKTVIDAASDPSEYIYQYIHTNKLYSSLWINLVANYEILFS